MQKTFETYYGGKEASGVYQTIINHIRPHRILVEAFGGNYTISRKISKCNGKFINDIDKKVFEKYPLSKGEFKFSSMNYLEFTDNILQIYGTWPCVVYFDPPYPLDSRKENRLRYNHEMTDEDHKEFLAYAISIKDKADILISTYPNDLYKDTLKDWYLVDFDGCDRHGKTTEWLFLNYDPETITELHDPQYYGKTFTERQKIKRHIKNTVKKIKEHTDPIIKREILRQLNAM